MLRSRLDRLVFRVLVVILVAAFLLYGIPAGKRYYHLYLRRSLVAASEKGDVGRVESLLARSADPDAMEEVNTSVPGGNPRYALELALINHHGKAAALLLHHGAQLTAYAESLAAKEADPTAYIAMIERGLPLEDTLITSLSGSNENLSRALLARYPGVKTNPRLLAKAASYGCEKLVTLLLENGVDVESRNDSGLTPLLCAVMTGRTEIVRILLAHGASIHAKDEQNMDALDHALQFPQPAVVQLLKQASARERDTKRMVRAEAK